MNFNISLSNLQAFTGSTIWQTAEDYLFFGRKVHHIVGLEKNLFTVEILEKKQSWLLVTFKVLSLATVIIPLLALIIRTAYRSRYYFHLKPIKNHANRKFNFDQFQKDMCNVKANFLQINEYEAEAKKWYSDCQNGVKNFSANKWHSIESLEKLGQQKGAHTYSYIKGAKIGGGDFGNVFQLNCNSNKSHKAIKYCTKKNLEREFYVLSRLYTKSTKPLTGVELPPKAIYIHENHSAKVMPKYNCNLDELLKNQKLTPEDGREIILQITQGLATLHSYKIAIFDFKLDNIFYREKNGVKRYDIADFGSSYTPNIPKMSEQFHMRWDLNCYKSMMDTVINTIGSHYFSTELVNYLNTLSDEKNGENLLRKINEIEILKI